MHCEYIYMLSEKVKHHKCHDWQYDLGQNLLLMINLTISEHSGKNHTRQQHEKFFNITSNIISALLESYFWL